VQRLKPAALIPDTDDDSTVDSARVKYVSARWGGEEIAMTSAYEIYNGIVLFPPEDVREEFLRATTKSRFDNPIGRAHLLDVVVVDARTGQRRVNRCGAWRYDVLKGKWKAIHQFVGFWKGVCVERTTMPFGSRAEEKEEEEDGEEKHNENESDSETRRSMSLDEEEQYVRRRTSKMSMRKLLMESQAKESSEAAKGGSNAHSKLNAVKKDIGSVALAPPPPHQSCTSEERNSEESRPNSPKEPSNKTPVLLERPKLPTPPTSDRNAG